MQYLCTYATQRSVVFPLRLVSVRRSLSRDENTRQNTHAHTCGLQALTCASICPIGVVHVYKAKHEKHLQQYQTLTSVSDVTPPIRKLIDKGLFTMSFCLLARVYLRGADL